jgi:hypothetical protein
MTLRLHYTTAYFLLLAFLESWIESVCKDRVVYDRRTSNYVFVLVVDNAGP